MTYRGSPLPGNIAEAVEASLLLSLPPTAMRTPAPVDASPN
jgi:hypothetical protein